MRLGCVRFGLFMLFSSIIFLSPPNLADLNAAGFQAGTSPDGRWYLNANTSEGWIEFTAGLLNLYVDEPITNIRFDAGTGRISFLRAAVDQQYTGVLSGSQIHGTFTQGGSGSFRWCAAKTGKCDPERPGAPPATTPPATTPPTAPPSAPGGVPSGTEPDGRWYLNANSYEGWIEFTVSRMNLGGDEPISNYVFDARKGQIDFLRPGVAQQYTGTLSGGQIHGTFTQSGAGSFRWCAAKTGKCDPERPGAPPATTPPATTPPTAPPSSGAKAGEPADVQQTTLQAGKRRVRPGETVTVPVWLINGSNLADMNFNLYYDPGIATPLGPAVKGNLLDQAMFESNANDRSVIRLGFAQTSNLGRTQPGTVAQIPFRVTGQPGGRTTLRLEVATAGSVSGDKPPVATINGEILIESAQKPTLPGDVNGDGEVDMGDALEALKMSVRLIPVKMVADVDGDGQVTSTDARLIRAKVLGR